MLSTHQAFITFFVILLIFSAPMTHADDALPQTLSVQVPTPLTPVGSGTYRKFGFSVYRATLWAPDGAWTATKPFALELLYTRSVSKDTLVDTVTDDIHDQGAADDVKLASWRKTLENALPAVQDGDTIIGLYLPGKDSQLFYNGTKVASIADADFARAFFNIWLGDTADEDLRNKLLGKTP